MCRARPGAPATHLDSRWGPCCCDGLELCVAAQVHEHGPDVVVIHGVLVMLLARLVSVHPATTGTRQTPQPACWVSLPLGVPAAMLRKGATAAVPGAGFVRGMQV